MSSTTNRHTEADLRRLGELARQIRRDVLRSIVHAGSGHPGGALGAAEIFAALYGGGLLSHDPEHPDDPDRDRLVLSNGHICAAWYAVLARSGFLPAAELSTLRRLGSRLQGHPSREKLPGLVETSSGPLGQGLSVANGLALALRMDRRPGRVYCIMGDGELHEGQVWEAVMTAAHYRLDAVTLIVNANGLQIDGEVERIKNIFPLGTKFSSFGWDTEEIDGHDLEQVTESLRRAGRREGKPHAIVARTVMGRGVSFMEGGAIWHGTCPTREQAEQALTELGDADGWDDFPIPEEIR